jgi:hypothetical protein
VATEKNLEIDSRKGLLDVALAIGRKRNEVLHRMRSAFERGDDAEALKLGKELCGIEDEQSGN